MESGKSLKILESKCPHHLWQYSLHITAMLRADAWTENYICTKFAQANMMQKSPNKRYIRGKDNKSQLLAFRKYYANVAFTTFGPDFLLVCYFLHCICPQQIWCKSVFSCLGDSLAKKTDVHSFIKTPNRGWVENLQSSLKLPKGVCFF